MNDFRKGNERRLKQLRPWGDPPPPARRRWSDNPWMWGLVVLLIFCVPWWAGVRYIFNLIFNRG